MEKEEKKSYSRETQKHYLNQVIKLTSPVKNITSHMGIVSPQRDVTRRAPPSVVLFPQTHNLILILRKMSDRSTWRDIVQHI